MTTGQLFQARRKTWVYRVLVACCQLPCSATSFPGISGCSESCKRQKDPSFGRPHQISIFRALLLFVLRKELRDFPGCCKLHSDFELGAKFLANRKLKQSRLVDLPSSLLLCRQCFIPTLRPPVQQHNQSFLPVD